MKAVWAWLCKWGWLGAFAIAAVLLGRKRSWWRSMKEEHKFIDVQRKASLLVEQQKFEQAVAHVKASYQDKLAKMEQKDRDMVQHLEADPEQLAAYLSGLHI